MYINKEESKKLSEAWLAMRKAYYALEEVRPGGGFKPSSPVNTTGPLIKRMEFEIKLLKKTAVAFVEALGEQGNGHTPDWRKCMELFDQCEDEMDMDS